ncbi:hypothetical protein [Xenorhabdus sp. Sc-CR9]|nr:hypothetical protein [Xenorhabdus sp. Sc-CR9]
MKKRHWEQGRWETTGPAKALLRAIDKDPLMFQKRYPTLIF